MNQEDYHGVRVSIVLSDKSYIKGLHLKMDIGVHNKLEIEQRKIVFSFRNDKEILLQVNSPEQIFSEKAYSLARLGVVSTRFKDIYDMYFLIKSGLNLIRTKNIIETMISDSKKISFNMREFVNRIHLTLDSTVFEKEASKMANKWLDVEYREACKTIIDWLQNMVN